MFRSALGRRIQVSVAIAAIALGLWPGLVSASAPSPSLTSTCATYPGSATVSWSHQNPGVTYVSIFFYDSSGTQLGGGVIAQSHPEVKGSVTTATTFGADHTLVTVQFGTIGERFVTPCT